MAKSGAVWGIDIGQSAIKALHCRPHESEKNRLVVEAFDFVEYPKLLSQPDAEPEELVAEALQTFLDRNDLKGDGVAVAVPGQAGLARFIKLPPVESKKIPDIVKYEARQQIPFQLEDVVWDYQPLAGGSTDEGFALETEIGLFAMKRDQVARSLDPLIRAGVEVDVIQLAPLALYNFACFDLLGDFHEQEFDAENPPPSKAILSLGVDTTDLVITNGFRVWQRSIQIGGSHFTKALTKELKLTFTKAEHLKKNAAKAEDPKSVFQAMRPVFSDLVAEIQRSIGFSTSNNQWARELTEVVAVGNAMKLPGLTRYLTQNLEIPVRSIEEFENLAGGSVTAQPAFQENRMAFPVCYGLCVQALGRSEMSTNLLPDDIVTERIIRAKKPWAVAAAAALMLGMAVNYSGYVSAYQTVDVEGEWSSALQQADSVSQMATRFSGDHSATKSKVEEIKQIGENLASNVDGRLLWMELWNAVRAAVPQDQRPETERDQTAIDISSRKEVHVTSFDCQKFDDLSTWFSERSGIWEDAERARQGGSDGEEAAAEDPALADPALADAPAPDPAAGGQFDPTGGQFGGAPGGDFGGGGGGGFGDPAAAGDGGGGGGPTGAGWVIQLSGHHFHNERGDIIGGDFVNQTLVQELIDGSIQLPDGPPGPDGKPTMIDVPYSELGISYPMLVTKRVAVEMEYDPEMVSSDGPGGFGGPQRARAAAPIGGLGEGPDGIPEPPEFLKLKRYDFIVQFAWTPTLRHQRIAGEDDAAAEDQGF